MRSSSKEKDEVVVDVIEENKRIKLKERVGKFR